MKINLDLFFKWVSLLIPLIGIFISYLVGLFSKQNNLKYKVLEKRYTELYVPIFNILLTTNKKPHEYPIESLDNFLDILMKKGYLLGNQSSEQLLNFYSAVVEFLNSKEPRTILINDSFDLQFSKMVNYLLQEGSQISKKLKYPDLSKTIAKIHINDSPKYK